jgi:hypothetical protein
VGRQVDKTWKGSTKRLGCTLLGTRLSSRVCGQSSSKSLKPALPSSLNLWGCLHHTLVSCVPGEPCTPLDLRTFDNCFFWWNGRWLKLDFPISLSLNAGSQRGHLRLWTSRSEDNTVTAFEYWWLGHSQYPQRGWEQSWHSQALSAFPCFNQF